MKKLTSTPLLHAADDFIKAPTRDNRDNLMLAADEYRDAWILAQPSVAKTATHTAKRRSLGTTYERALEVTRMLEGIPITLALQERTSGAAEECWWTLSWRTKYAQGGPNRRFYSTKDGCWTIPAALALEMIEEMETRGGLDEKYFDLRRRPNFESVVSSKISLEEREAALSKITGPDEDWGASPFFVIASDPNGQWKKVLIVNTDNGVATFRSITENAEYMPKKVLRPDEGWWLDNSMMDANVQQMRVFYSNLRDCLASKK
jgi:hypothetical protein